LNLSWLFASHIIHVHRLLFLILGLLVSYASTFVVLGVIVS
jgi:hypothetical protein